jgi:hypothetical protein
MTAYKALLFTDSHLKIVSEKKPLNLLPEQVSGLMVPD